MSRKTARALAIAQEEADEAIRAAQMTNLAGKLRFAEMMIGPYRVEYLPHAKRGARPKCSPEDSREWLKFRIASCLRDGCELDENGDLI